MKNKKWSIIYLILAHLMLGILMWVEEATLIQVVGGYLFIWFMVLYFIKVRKNIGEKQMKVKLTFHEEVLGQKLPDHHMELREMWYERDEGNEPSIAFTDIEGYTYVYHVDYIKTMLVEENEK